MPSRYKLLAYSIIILFISIHANTEEFDYEKQMEKYEEQVRKKHIDPVEVDIIMTEKELAAWEGLKTRMDMFSSTSKALYDPTTSPFNLMKAESSNPTSFEANTLPSSLGVGEHNVQVLQLAKNDIIASKPFAKNQKINGSVFSIKTQDKRELSINFAKGGSLEELHKIFEKEKNDIVRTSITKVDKEHSVLLIEAKKTGLANSLALVGDPLFFNEIGFFKQHDKEKQTQYIDLSALDKDLINGSYEMHNDRSMLIKPNTKIKLKLKPNRITKTLIFSAEVNSEKIKAKQIQKEQKEQKEKLPVGTIESLRVGRIMLYTNPLIHDLEKTSDNKDNKKNTKTTKIPGKTAKHRQAIDFIGRKDNSIINSFEIKTPRDKKQQKGLLWKKIKVNILPKNKINKIKNDKNSLKAENVFLFGLAFENSKKDHNLIIRNLRIYDPFAEERDKHYNFIEKAADAILLFNGLYITRSSNDIDDILKGVVLNLKSPSDRTDTLRLYRDYETTTEYIDKFVNEYNNLMLYVNNLTEYLPRRNLEELEKEEEEFNKKNFEEKQYARLSGELYKGFIKDSYMLRSLKSKVRNIMVNTPYNRLSEKTIKFLFQIGVKNASSAFDSSLDKENIRAGYLSLDKDILKAKLRKYFGEIRELFAHSKSEGFLKDSGIAVKIVETIDSYAKITVRSEQGAAYPGPIEARKRSLKRQQAKLHRRKSDREKQVDKKVSQFKQKIKKLKHTRQEGERNRRQFEAMFKGMNR